MLDLHMCHPLPPLIRGALTRSSSHSASAVNLPTSLALGCHLCVVQVCVCACVRGCTCERLTKHANRAHRVRTSSAKPSTLLCPDPACFLHCHLLPLTTLKHVCLPSTPPSPSLHTREHPSNTTQTPSLAPFHNAAACLFALHPSSLSTRVSIPRTSPKLPPSPLFTTLKHV